MESAQTVLDQADAELLASLRRLAANMGDLMGVSSVAVTLLEPISGDLRARVVWPSPASDGATPSGGDVAPEEAVEGHVATRRELVVVEDAQTHPPLSAAPDPHPGALVCLPLVEADRLLGTLTVTAAKPRTFDPDRLRLVQVFAEQAALAIGKTMQVAAAQAQARELAALLEASRALTSTLEPAQVLDQIAVSLRGVLGCDDALIYALDPASETLRLVAGLGPRAQRVGATEIALDDPHSLAARVAATGRPALIDSDTGELGQVTEVFVGADRLSLLAAPLFSKHAVRGVVVLARAHPFRPAVLAEMTTLGNLIAAALENVSLYQTARAGAEQLAAIFAAASDAVALIDDGLRILQVNDAFAALTTLPAAQLRGQRCPDVLRVRAIPGNPLCDEHGPLARIARSEPVAHVECLFARLPGDERHADPTDPRATANPASVRAFDFSITPIPGPTGYRALLVGRDMTIHREVEQLRSTFLSMVSHELRGPLQSVNGYLDLVLSGQAGPLSPRQRQYVARSRAGGQRLATIVDDLMLLSRRDAGQFALRREPVDLVPLIHEVADEMEVLAEEAGVRLELALPKHLAPALADGPRVAQVLRNLLSNALRFTPRGGTITVSADVDADHVTVRVRDTGIGIPAEHQARIFERFYQVPAHGDGSDGVDGGEGEQRKRPAGQGLGLAIVRIIVERHDGSVSVESAPGQGSSFTFTLPLA